MAKNNKLKAYVRFDGSGRIVPSSLILSRFKPAVGNWQEIDANECCNPPIGICSTFYIIQVENLESPGDLYASSGAAMDTNCNTFLPMVNYWDNPNNPNASVSHQNNILQKYNESGELLWEKGFDYDLLQAPYTYCEVQASLVDNANNLIVPNIAYSDAVRSTGITKFDNNGNELWSNLMETDPLVYTGFQNQYVYDLKVDSSNNIYIVVRVLTDEIDRFDSINIRKISPLGVVLESKVIIAVSSIGLATININSNGDVYLLIYQDTTLNVVKLDSTLNEIWNKLIDATKIYDYIYGLQFDPLENIVLTIGNGLTSFVDDSTGAYVKLSPDGDVKWTTKLINTVDPTITLGSYQLDTDKEGNVYSSIIIQNQPIPGYAAVGSAPLIISKFSNDGTYQWSYVIDINNIDIGFGFWYNYKPISGKIVNNTLVLGFYAYNNSLVEPADPFNAQLLKLPLTQLTPGTYGPYVVTDITSLWSVSSPVITLSDDTSLVYEDAPLTVTKLNYIEFANPTTITKTLIS